MPRAESSQCLTIFKKRDPKTSLAPYSSVLTTVMLKHSFLMLRHNFPHSDSCLLPLTFPLGSSEEESGSAFSVPFP